MTINATKKIGLFLSITLMHGSAFGMKKIKKAMPTIVLSGNQQILAAVGLPVAVAVCGIIAKYKDEIGSYSSDIIQAIPDDYKKVASGVGILAGTSVVGYYTAGSLTSEKRQNYLIAELGKIRDHQLIKMSEDVKALSNIENSTTELKAFIGGKFTVNGNDKPFSSIIATQKISKLKNKAEQLKEQIEVLLGSNASSDQLKASLSNEHITELKKHISSLVQFSSTISNLPGYAAEQVAHDQAQTRVMKEEQSTWINKCAPFIAALATLLLPFSQTLAYWLQVKLVGQG
jgi:hypothetical protein